MRALGLLLLVLVLAACPPGGAEPREPVPLSLSVRVKGSCDISPVLYRTGCLAALEVRVDDLSGRTVARHCEPLEPRFETLADLLTAPEPAVKLAGLTSLGTVVFRVAGIHDQGDLADAGPNALCARADETASWLFWGESEPVALDKLEAEDAGPLAVQVSIDCRDCAGGCATLGSSSCPADLPPSYCVPFTPGLSCARRCDADEECFEGSHVCDPESGRCNPRLGHPKTGNTGGFCFPCTSSADCDVDFACVAAPGQSEGICALRCPENRCLDGATCKRLGAELFLLD